MSKSKLRRANRNGNPRAAIVRVQPVSVEEAVQAAAPLPSAPPREPIQRTIPQLILVLTPNQAGLQIELPGANGMRRVIPVSRGDKLQDVALRILQAQARQQIEIGLDGAPTSRQLLHWERHWMFPDDRCPFCIAEGTAHRPSKRWQRASEHVVGDGSVTVRRVPPKGRPMRQKLSGSLESLGL